MRNKYIFSSISILIGLFFVLSGAGKIVNTIGFTNVLLSYGFGSFSYVAPLICVGEIVLGLLMLLLVNQKKYALYSLIVLFVFTISFAYAHFFKNIKDCGCFGEIGFLNSSATFSFLRNGILIIFCLLLFIYSSNDNAPIDKWKLKIIYFISFLSIGLGGFTMNESLITDSPFEKQRVENTPLAKYINPSSDSTYLIFVFSYSCPHCWDATENIKNYLETKKVSRVIGIALGDKKSKEFYYSSLKPNFEVINSSRDSIRLLTKVIPTAFFIKNDTIQNVMQKTIYSPFTFKQLFPLLIN